MPACFTVITPGLFTTVQDLGRPGLARFGIATGGALDRTALILGNRLLGNEPGAAALECTLSGPTIRFEMEAVIAITGGALGPTLDGASIPMWHPVAVHAGSKLSFAPSPVGTGARAYLCFAGGIDVPIVLGSRATDLTGEFGGLDGRPLRAGDQLSMRTPSPSVEELLRRRLVADPPEYWAETAVRVVTGPQHHRFTSAGMAALLGDPYRVTSKADRTGIRLLGAAIEQTNGADLISEGIAHGAIQVPGDGQPIVLLAARGTMGGYTKIATVIGADLDALAQVRPGDRVRFLETDLDTARQATRELVAAQSASVITTTAHSYSGGIPTVPIDDSLANAWTPDGVIRVLAEAERTGVHEFRLDVASAGLNLTFSRGAAASPASSPADQSNTESTTTIITAPVLGTFYQRRKPEDPPLVTVGDWVEAGALLGLIEVMKTYHEVTAPIAGTIERLLAEDGHYVEYGEPLIHLSPAT